MAGNTKIDFDNFEIKVVDLKKVIFIYSNLIRRY